jgi:phage terminase large subunit-like protein
MAKKQQTAVKTNSQFMSLLAKGLKNAALAPDINRYTPHEKQEIFHASNAKIRLLIGGNRSGKTVGGATEAIYYLTGRHPFRETPPPPVRGRCISVDFLNGVEKIVKPEIAKWLPLSELRGGSWATAYDKQLRTLWLENGSFLEFMSYDQDLDKFAGTSRHFVWFDEEPPKDIYTENRMRLLDIAGDTWLTMTPVDGMTWIYDDVYLAAKTDPNIKVVEVDQGENPYLNHAERDSFLSGLSADERKARVSGKFVQIGGLVYKDFSEKNILDPFSPPEEWLHVAAMDHGLNNPTAWLWAAVNRAGDIYVFDEHYEAGKVVSYHASAVLQKEGTHRRPPDYRVGDPSIKARNPITGTSIHLEYIEHGVPIVLGDNTVNAGINRVSRLIRGPLVTDDKGNQVNIPKLYVTRNCVNLIHELYRYRWGTWSTKKMNYEKNKKEDPHKKDDHAVDALRYLVASRPEIEDWSVPEVPRLEGSNPAVDPYAGRIDEDVSPGLRRYSSKNSDEILGGEW